MNLDPEKINAEREAETKQFWELFNAEAESLANKPVEEIELRILQLQELEKKIKAYKQAALVAHREKTKDEKAEEKLRQKLHDMEYKIAPLPDDARKAKAQVKASLSAIDKVILSFAKLNPNPQMIYDTLKTAHPSITLKKVIEVLDANKV